MNASPCHDNIFWKIYDVLTAQYVYNMPTKRSNAQHLVEYEKQLLHEENKKSGNVMQHAAYGFLRLWYKYELRKYSHLVVFTFRVINTFLSNSGIPILRKKYI